MSTRTFVRLGATGITPLLALTLLVGCSSDPGTTDSSTTGPPTGGTGGFDPALLGEVSQCLTAAGIEVPGGLPTGAPPTAASSTQPPAGLDVTALQTLFKDKQVQRALRACNIDLPAPPTN